MPHRAPCGPIVARFCFVFSGFEDAVAAPSLRTNYIPFGLILTVSTLHFRHREARLRTHGFWLGLIRRPVCGRITDPLGLNPAGVFCLACMPHRAPCGPIAARFCFVFSGFENAASAPSLRTNYRPLGLESCWGLAVSHACRTEPFADRLWPPLLCF